MGQVLLAQNVSDPTIFQPGSNTGSADDLKNVQPAGTQTAQQPTPTNTPGGAVTQKNTAPPPSLQLNTSFNDGGLYNRPSPFSTAGYQINGNLKFDETFSLRGEFRFPSAITNSALNNTTDLRNDPTEIDGSRNRVGPQVKLGDTTLWGAFQSNPNGSQYVRVELNQKFVIDPKLSGNVGAAYSHPIKDTDAGLPAPRLVEVFGNLNYQVNPNLRLSTGVLNVSTLDTVGTVKPNNYFRLSETATWDIRGNGKEKLEGSIVWENSSRDGGVNVGRVEASYWNTTNDSLKLFTAVGTSFADAGNDKSPLKQNQVYGTVQLEGDSKEWEWRGRIDFLRANSPVLQSSNVTVDASIGYKLAPDGTDLGKGWTAGVYGAAEFNSATTVRGETSSNPTSAGVFVGKDIAPNLELQLRVPVVHSDDTSGSPRVDLKLDL